MKYAAIAVLLASVQTGAWADCHMIDVDGQLHQVCDNSPPPSADFSFGAKGLLEALQAATAIRQAQQSQEQLELQGEQLRVRREQLAQQHRDGPRLAHCGFVMEMEIKTLQTNLQSVQSTSSDHKAVNGRRLLIRDSGIAARENNDFLCRLASNGCAG